MSEAEGVGDSLAARRQAAALLQAALDRRGGLDEASERSAFRTLDLRDRAFARALALTTLRRLGAIDRALDARLQKPPPPAVKDLLRLGVAQAFYMDVPAFAAVDTSVAIAAADKDARPYKNLVNAVLRGLLRDGPPEAAPAANAPDWLYARWAAAYGEEAAQGIAGVIPLEPPTDLTPRAAADAEAIAAEVEGRVQPGGSVRTDRRGDIAGWPGFEEGRWWVQDAAAAVPTRLLGVQEGERALDLCAAPGGKTLQMAAAGASVVSVDRSAARLRRLQQNLERTGLKAEVVPADAGAWPDRRTFDAVLLDAPCASTGTFRRNPDVLWGVRPGDIAKLAGVQAALLDSAAERVRPGGRLVYCVCSLEPEEGERQVDDFLRRRNDFVTAPVEPGEGGAPEGAATREGWLRILPCHLGDQGGMDGFFAARLVRRT